MREGSGFSFAGRGVVSRLGAPIGLGGAATGRSAILLALFSWLPLLVLSLLAGRLTGDGVAEPFSQDVAVHARLLLCIPLLLLADGSVNGRLAVVVDHWRAAGLLPAESRAAFDKAVERLIRQRDSSVSEVVIALAAAGIALFILVGVAAPRGDSWLSQGGSPTAAGWWYGAVGLVVFLFLFLRWIWRGWIWSAFLRAVSRMRLALSAGHPDRSGGLGFLCWGQGGFTFVVVALAVVFAAGIAQSVVFRGGDIRQYKIAVGVFLVLVVVLVFAPLLFFGKPLRVLRRKALFAYSALAVRHQAAFEEKWLGDPGADATLLGSPDASSMADLGTDYEMASRLRGLPVDLKGVMPVLFAAILPFLPVVATVVPLKDVLMKLLKIVA